MYYREEKKKKNGGTERDASSSELYTWRSILAPSSLACFSAVYMLSCTHSFFFCFFVRVQSGRVWIHAEVDHVCVCV